MGQGPSAEIDGLLAKEPSPQTEFVLLHRFPLKHLGAIRAKTDIVVLCVSLC